MTDEERELIDGALLAARLRRPYYARAIAALRPVVNRQIPTIGVDRNWRLYVNPDYLAKQTTDHKAGLIGAHEIEHLLRDHCGGRACTALENCTEPHWLLATDLEINDDAGKGELPTDGFWPAKLGLPDGLLAEDYVDLLKEMTPKKGKACSGGTGTGAGKLPGELDDDGEMGDKDAAEMREAVARDVQQHIKEHGRGSVPDGTRMWADAVCPRAKQLPWTSILARAVAQARSDVTTGKADYSWRRISRRQRDDAPLRPSSVAYKPTVGLVVDTSGSMCNLGSPVITTVASIARRNGNIVVYQTDAAVHTKTRGIPRTWAGGGGTDLRGAIELAAKECDYVVVITDGDTPWPEAAVRVPTIAVVPDGAQCPDWVRTIKMENDK
jgi:predicted metal-dependent peptidase